MFKLDLEKAEEPDTAVSPCMQAVSSVVSDSLRPYGL